MVKKIGIFTDIHGSWNNLETLINSLKKEGANSAIFLGDAIYDTQSAITNKQSQDALNIKEKLRQDSGLRKAVIEGKYTDEQLEDIADRLDKNTKLSKRIATSEYKRMKDILGDMNLTFLGGNWDYEKELKDVFENSYLNGDSKELEGVSIAGFSGGGSAFPKTIPDQTLADNHRDGKNQYKKWKKLLLEENKEYDIFASHLPFTLGEGVMKENAVEQLKKLFMLRKRKGLDVPEVIMNGHNHTTGNVEYNEELEAFSVYPGTCSDNHKENNVSTFMIGDFDDDNKLQNVQKYEIRSSLEGLRKVVLTSEFKLDYENKEVDEEQKDEIILEEADQTDFITNLSMDDNYELMKKGFNLDYEGKSIKEKDHMLRHNIAVMFKDVENKQKSIKNVIKGTLEAADKVDENIIDDIYINLSDKALNEFSASLEHVEESEQEFYRDVILDVAYGIETGNVHKLLRENIPEDLASSGAWSKKLLEAISNKLNQRSQNYLLDLQREDNPSAGDFQSMAELHMPKNYERKRDLMSEKALSLWVKTYKNPLLTDEDLNDFKEAYEIKEEYSKNKKTKQEIADMFGFETSGPLKIKTTDDLPEDYKNGLYNKIENDGLPVFKDDKGKEYIITPFGRIPIGKEIKENMDYETSSEEYMRNNYSDLQKPRNLEPEQFKDLPEIIKQSNYQNDETSTPIIKNNGKI